MATKEEKAYQAAVVASAQQSMMSDRARASATARRGSFAAPRMRAAGSMGQYAIGSYSDDTPVKPPVVTKPPVKKPPIVKPKPAPKPKPKPIKPPIKRGPTPPKPKPKPKPKPRPPVKPPVKPPVVRFPGPRPS